MTDFYAGNATWRLNISVGQIEVTQSGLLGGEPDTMRQFIPGMMEYRLLMPDGRTTIFINKDEADWLMGDKPSDEEVKERFRDQLQDR